MYCYRAGYYPAALAQWTRIPESNRKLRPSIQHLLEELNSRLALEEQETQPMRRDQILNPEPVITGNLPPADLPNPHEPVRSEETHDHHAVSRTEPHQQTVRSQSLSMPSSKSDGKYSQQHASLDQPAGLTDWHNGHKSTSSGEDESLQEAGQSNGKQHWLARILHITPDKNP
jgi:hypothetical protein